MLSGLGIDDYDVSILIELCFLSGLGIGGDFVSVRVVVLCFSCLVVFLHLVSSLVKSLSICSYDKSWRIVANVLAVRVCDNLITVCIIFMMISVFIDDHSIAMFVVFDGITILIVDYFIAMMIISFWDPFFFPVELFVWSLGNIFNIIIKRGFSNLFTFLRHSVSILDTAKLSALSDGFSIGVAWCCWSLLFVSFKFLGSLKEIHVLIFSCQQILARHIAIILGTFLISFLLKIKLLIIFLIHLILDILGFQLINEIIVTMLQI